MKKILTAAAKELLLLRRDRTGLLILFIMPALLVIVITLVQENVMELTGQKKLQVLFLDTDNGALGNSVRRLLGEANIDTVVLDSAEYNDADLQKTVAAGKYQVGIVIPAGASAKFHNSAARLFQTDAPATTSRETAPQPISIFFDPGVLPGFRSGVKTQLSLVLRTISMESKIANLVRKFNSTLDSLGLPQEYAPLSSKDLAKRLNRPILALQEGQTDAGKQGLPEYNPVQQNVPAWAIFGMFFTAIPIAGTILQERTAGIWIRLASLPVSQLQLFTGKVIAYIAVCLCQFLLVGLIGYFLFPHIGLPPFTVFQNIPGVLLTILCISFAACGFGILLGILCNSYEQASAVGASFVVTAAALGGVMVPVYAMPEIMQHLSIVSPLNWGLNAFQDLLVRGYSFFAVADDLARLVIFFLLAIIFAWKLSRSRI